MEFGGWSLPPWPKSLMDNRFPCSSRVILARPVDTDGALGSDGSRTACRTHAFNTQLLARLQDRRDFDFVFPRRIKTLPNNLHESHIPVGAFGGKCFRLSAVHPNLIASRVLRHFPKEQDVAGLNLQPQGSYPGFRDPQIIHPPRAHEVEGLRVSMRLPDLSSLRQGSKSGEAAAVRRHVGIGMEHLPGKATLRVAGNRPLKGVPNGIGM